MSKTLNRVFIDQSCLGRDIQSREAFYNPETLDVVTLITVMSGGNVRYEADVDYSLTEALSRFGVPEDIRVTLAVLMDVPEEKSERLRYCTNSHCSHRFNWGDMNRCESCGEELPEADNPAQLPNDANLCINTTRSWALVRRALKLVEEGKLNAYVGTAAFARSLVFGYPERIFDMTKHSFRGRANLQVFKTFSGTKHAPAYDSAHERSIWSEEGLTDSILNFSDTHGEALQSGGKVEIDPSISDTLRSDYIFNEWEFGKYGAENDTPKRHFCKTFFKDGAVDSEVLSEAAWAVYSELLKKAETKALVRKNGKVMWRFGSCVEVFDAEEVKTLLTTDFNATENDLAAILKEEEDDS